MLKQKVFFLLLLLLFACQTSEEVKESETYTYLEVCLEDYYLNYDVEITPLLNEFELLLLNEGHIADTTGAAYKKLIDTLAENDYFKTPLKKEDFNNVALYKNPASIIQCATQVFGIDSTKVTQLNFSKIGQQINAKIDKDKDISIHYILNLYKTQLSNEEIRMPYVKQSLLILFYRWYFKSKYDREIDIEKNISPKSKSK